MIRVVTTKRLQALVEDFVRGEGPSFEVLTAAARRREPIVLPVVSVLEALEALRSSYAGDALRQRCQRLRSLVDLSQGDDFPVVLAGCPDLPTSVEGWFGAEGMSLPWERLFAATVDDHRRRHPPDAGVVPW
jgi:hypothetical protein